ncbi:MAG: DUF1214 domain-containing protein [Dinoroseobacter sp.]|nr:DUF1214 domain-containing protein [Dinoroseobacter sp.]
MRKAFRIAAVYAALVSLQSDPATSQSFPSEISEDLVTDAYVYLLGRALVARQEQIDLEAHGVGYNAIFHNELASASFVNPNFAVTNSEAWIAVDDDTGVLFEIPEVEDRYYTVQITDEWGEVITNLNERNYPLQPFGTFALVAQGSNADIPEDAVRIELRSSKAKILARFALENDPEGAVELQQGYTVTALGDVDVKPVVDLPMFENDTLIGVEIFEYLDALLDRTPDVSPVAAQLQAAAREIADAVSNPAQRDAVDDFLMTTVIPEFNRFAVEASGAQRNNWVGTLVVGNYGEDFDIRTAANLVGIWANARHEVIYYVTARDAAGALLDGSQTYVMNFPANALPETVVNEFWSLTLVGFPDFMPVANPLDRHVIGTYTGVETNADGSLTLAMGPEPVSGVPESNWLPTQAGQPFSLTFRTYVPKDVVKTGDWFVPPVDPLD